MERSDHDNRNTSGRKEPVEDLMKKIYRKRSWNYTVTFIACVLVFIMTYMLILPAITMTKNPVCGLEEHIHTDECWADTVRILDCPYTNDSSGVIYLHTHDESCRDENGVLVCTLPEIQAHVHTAECYSESGAAGAAVVQDFTWPGEAVADAQNSVAEVITPEETTLITETGTVGADSDTAGSLFGESDLFASGSMGADLVSAAGSDEALNAYAPAVVSGESLDAYVPAAESTQMQPTAHPLCGKAEIIPHVHNESCYDEFGNLICTLPVVIEHHHTEECFKTVPVEPYLICGMEEHIHDDSCYVKEKDVVLIDEDGTDPLASSDDINGLIVYDEAADMQAQDEIVVYDQDAEAQTGDEFADYDQQAVIQEIKGGSIIEDQAKSYAGIPGVTGDSVVEILSGAETAAEVTSEVPAEMTTESIMEPNSEEETSVETSTESTTEFATEEGRNEAFTVATAEVGFEADTVATTEASAEAGSEGSTEIITEAAPEVSSETDTEITTEAVSEATSEADTEITTEAVPEATSETDTEITTEAVPEATSETDTEITTEAVPEVTSEASTETTTENTPEVSTEAVTEKPTEVSVEITSESDEEETVSVLEYRGKDYKVLLTYDDAAEIPAGSILSAEEITPEDEAYAHYLAQAKKALMLPADTSLPKDYARFFDITILDEDGTEIQPKTPVRMEILYDEPAVNLNDENVSANVLHFAEDKDEPDVLPTLEKEAEEGTMAAAVNVTAEGIATEDVTAADTMVEGAIDSDVTAADETAEDTSTADAIAENVMYATVMADSFTGEEKVDNLAEAPADAQDIPAEASLAFTTGAFSVYGIIYTVDFTYESRTWSFPGQGSYRLTDVLAALGIEGSIDDAALTLIMGEDHVDALYLTQVDGEYYINSDIPFKDTYELRVRVGEKIYIITVTDTQESTNLSDFLKNAVITGATQDSDGKYHVEKDEEYSIILTFAEDSSYQFADNQTLTYQMPEGITILSQQEGDANTSIVYKGRTYQVGYHYILKTDGTLVIHYDTSDPDFPKLQDSTNVSFRFTYNGQFGGEITKIQFSDSIERDIIFDEPEPAQAYVAKNGTFDEATGTYHYTVKVTASGAVTDVRVKDVISGNALSFNNDVQVSGNSSEYTNNGGGNGFDYSFASMQEGEEITITYSANLDPSKIPANGKVTADMTRNTVIVTSDDGPPHNSSYSHEINLKKPDKNTGVESGTTTDGKKLYKWTIDYNTLALAKADGDTVSDSIGESSRQYMKYYGDVSVKVYNHSGSLVDTRSFRPATDYTWTYIVPDTDTTPCRYVFEYETAVDQAAVDLTGSSVKLDNDSEGPGGKDSEGITIGPKESTSITKEVVSSNEQEVTWISHIHVPASGLSKAVVTDTLPSIWSGNLGLSGNYMLYDLYKAESLEITGLDDQEAYTVDVASFDKIVITFFKDSAKTEEGLNPSAGGRDITVKLTTTIDPDWLNAGYSYPKTYQSSHTNKININGGEDVQAEVKYIEPSIEKSGLQTGKGVYKYTIYVTHVDSSPIVVNDIFDTSLLEVDTSLDGRDWNKQSMYITGGDYPGHVYSGDTSVKVDYSDTTEGIQITANNVPLQSNGQFYPTYMITYFLKLKEGVDLEQLAIANGGKHDLTNTAIWNGHEGSFTFTTTYDFLDKQLLNDGQLGETSRKAQYQITFNSAKATLHGGEPMEMTDIISANLSVDYSSIHIVTDPEGQAVPYSLSGGKDEHGDPDGTTVATYSVPDSTKVVITYDADVRGNGSQTIVNKVSVNGEDETVTATKSYGSASEGAGAVAYFKIIKVDGYDANKKLKGVKFKIFAENEGIDFGEKAGHVKELVLETDENGEIVLDGDQYKFFFDECYHVQEVAPLPDYGTISFDYQVTLTNDMNKVDYGHYIYYYNDQMQIKNWPLEGLVVEKQVESTDDADKERYYKFRVSVLTDDGTVNTDYNEKNGDDQFVKGSFEFELKDKEQKMLWGFQKGTKYKVEEIDSKGLAVSVTYSVFDEEGTVTEIKTDTDTKQHTGTLTQENEVIVFKNTKTEQKGALKLKKNVTVNGDSTTSNAADGTYTFTITGCETPETTVATVNITVTNGVAASATVNGQTVNLVDGFVVISDLTPGDYTITETKPTNGTSISKINGVEHNSYSTTVKVVAGETVGEDATATFTNNLPTTSVKVTKQWKPAIPKNTTITLGLYSRKEAESAAAAETLVTEIDLDGTADSAAVNINGTDAKAGTRQETAGWTAEFKNLPMYAYNPVDGVYEVKYVVREINVPNGYKVSYNGAGGGSDYVITGGTITNTKTKDFEFTKIWRDLSQQDTTWPPDKTITVTFNAFAGDKKKAFGDKTLTFSATGNPPEGWVRTPSEDGKKTTFKITGLDANDEDGNELIYYVVETKVDDYKDPSYAFDNQGTVTIKPDNDPTKNIAVNENYIINKPEDGFKLPQTGGIGTTLFTALGSLLTFTAGAILLLRRKRKTA